MEKPLRAGSFVQQVARALLPTAKLLLAEKANDVPRRAGFLGRLGGQLAAPLGFPLGFLEVPCFLFCFFRGSLGVLGFLEVPCD